MPPRTKKPKDMADELRQAIRESGLTAYRLAKMSGVSASQIGRLVSAERTLTLVNAAKLASVLGLQLAPVAVAPVADKPVSIHGDEVLAAIRSNAKGHSPARLADVFKTLQQSHQALTLGTFHDAIRALRTAGKITLEPFTGAAYQLKNGEACLVLGTEIMAFASTTEKQVEGGS